MCGGSQRFGKHTQALKELTQDSPFRRSPQSLTGPWAYEGQKWGPVLSSSPYRTVTMNDCMWPEQELRGTVLCPVSGRTLLLILNSHEKKPQSPAMWLRETTSFLLLFFYFHIQKDKTWNSSRLFLLFCWGVAASSHRGKKLHSHRFIWGPSAEFKQQNPNLADLISNLTLISKITTVKRNKDPLQMNELWYNVLSKMSSFCNCNYMDVCFRPF